MELTGRVSTTRIFSIHSIIINPTTKNSTSWIGRMGPPSDLSVVVVQPPLGTLTEEEMDELIHEFSDLIGSADNNDIVSLWTQALVFVCHLYPNIF